MARHEADREDMMREATAYARRCEIHVPDLDEPLFAGFREFGAWSLYFGGDPVFQFDEECQLRRAYVDGLLYRTQGTTLAQLRRVRSATATELLRYDLTPPELSEFRAGVSQNLNAVASSIQAGEAKITRQIPTGNPYFLESLLAVIRRALEEGIPLAEEFPWKS